MDAFFAKNRLSAYLDGSLPESEAAEVEQALASDPALRAEYDAMKRAVGLLRGAGRVSAPPDLHARVMARVAREPMPVGRLHWLRRPFERVPMEGLALAAAALLVVLAIQWKPDRPAVQPPEAEPVAATQAKDAPDPATAQPTPASPQQKPLSLGTALPVSPASKLAPSTNATPTTSPTAAPDEPYVPEWEKADTTTSQAPDMAEGSVGLDEALTRGVEQRTALYYRLTTVDAEALETLAGIAERAGGRLVDGQGQPARAGTLTMEDNFTSVSIVVPPGSLGEVTGALRQLGAQGNTPPASGPLHPADQVILVLEVLYKP